MHLLDTPHCEVLPAGHQSEAVFVIVVLSAQSVPVAKKVITFKNYFLYAWTLRLIYSQRLFSDI